MNTTTNNSHTFLQGVHPAIRAKLHHFYKSRKIPHILFYGENGCGKKTLVMDFINLIYDGDKQKIKQNTMFSNCSHSKGIKHIRENLKEYSRSNVRNEENIYFKTIILYNFENLSVDGQSALRRVIEAYSQTTRFFLILQNKQRILQPILSRFSHIYVPLPIIDGLPTNLHQYNLRQFFGEASSDAKIAPFFIEPLKNHKEIIDLCETLYEGGFSCLDIINYVSVHYDKSEAANIIMCFHRVKSEYRNEKMLMLYILDYMFLRKDKSIKSVAFM